MRYRNKDIRSMYSVSFASYIVGLVLTLLGASAFSLVDLYLL